MISKKMLKQLITTLLSIAALLTIAIMIIKRFVIFQPSSQELPMGNMNYETIRQGHLRALFFKGAFDKVILFCCGNAGNITYRTHKINELQNLGFSVMIFDYSGYGQSSGIPTEQRCYDDAGIMMALLLQSHKPENIILYGESMGAPIATYTARRYNIPTLILDSPLPSIKTVIDSKYSFLSFLGIFFSEFDTRLYLDGYRGRTLMFHSPTDEIISYDSTMQLQRLVTKFIPINGNHNNPVIPWEEIGKFC